MKDPETLSLRKHSKGQNGKTNKQTKKKKPSNPCTSMGVGAKISVTLKTLNDARVMIPGFPDGPVVKNLPASEGDTGFIPG